MKLERLELYHIRLPLIHPFQTSFSARTARESILVCLRGEGLTGWGECTAELGPWYSGETIQTAWHILRDFLAAMLLGKNIESPADLVQLIAPVRGNPMAKGAVENAAWDLLGRARGESLSQMLGSTRARVEVGVSLGIEPSIDALLGRIERYLNEGYRRIKIKIKPSWDIEPLRQIRAKYPDISLMVDANSAYTLADTEHLRQVDDFNLLMIEQPLAYDDIADHARLQRQMRTAICLDESLRSPADMQAAIDLQACRIVNIKVGRVGGLTNAKHQHDMAAEAKLPAWCGDMLESGVGRAINLHLASLNNFSLPADVSANSRYYAEDIAYPMFTLNADSSITIPTGAGSGVDVDEKQLEKFTVNRLEIASL
jgi:o-succinylbenzoate synthase